MLFINRSYIGKYMGFVVNRICSRLLIFNISNAGLGTLLHYKSLVNQ